MNFWQQLSALWLSIPSDLRTALIGFAIVLLQFIGGALLLRRTARRERARHTAEMQKLSEQTEAGKIANENYVRKSATELGARLDSMAQALEVAQKALHTAEVDFAHKSGVMEGQIQTLTAQNADFAVRLAERDRQNSELKAQVSDLQAKVAALTKSLQSTSEERDKAQADLAVRNQERVSMQTKIATLEGEVKRLESRVKELEVFNVKKPDTGPLVAITVSEHPKIEEGLKP